MTVSLLASLRALVARDWRTVAIAARSASFAGTVYPLHGVIDREPVRVPYRVLLQQDERGRRRVSFECSNDGVSRSQLRTDPIVGLADQWVRGGKVPAPFLALPG